MRPDNKLNLLVGNAFRIWQETEASTYLRAGRQALRTTRRRADDLL